jgi:hypothetical protein
MIPKTGTPPSFRELPGIALFESAQKIYIYGGRFETLLGDMWQFDLNNNQWSEIHISSTLNPGPRSEAYLFPIEATSKIVMFGGNSLTGPVSDLWEFDINNESVSYI